ncbi:hypothetical protein RFI_10409, partial [Reticulomyxa filosa]
MKENEQCLKQSKEENQSFSSQIIKAILLFTNQLKAFPLQKQIKTRYGQIKAKKMFLNAQKLDFHSNSGFVAALAFNLLCGVYCLWLSYVVWRNLWAVTRERVGSEMTSEIQMSSQKSTTEMSVSISATEKIVRRSPTIDLRIKWIATLYVFGCALACIGSVCEPLIYALVDSPGQACSHGLYIVFLRVFIDGLFYSFYLIRTVVLLQGSVLEVPKYRQYFLAVAPVITFGCVLFAHNLRLQLRSCDTTGPAEMSIIAATIIIHLFWNITLFSFLVYHVYK